MSYQRKMPSVLITDILIESITKKNGRRLRHSHLLGITADRQMASQGRDDGLRSGKPRPKASARDFDVHIFEGHRFCSGVLVMLRRSRLGNGVNQRRCEGRDPPSAPDYCTNSPYNRRTTYTGRTIGLKISRRISCTEPVGRHSPQCVTDAA